MVACTGGGGGETAVLVGGSEVEYEVGEGFRGFGFGAPVTARNFEKAGLVDDVIAETDDSGSGWLVVAGGGKADAVVKLGEKLVDGGGGIPW